MKVRIKIRVRLTDGTYPFLDPVLSSNGKLKPFFAIVGGKPEYHPEGTYFLRYLRDGKRVWEPVGNDAQLALTTKQKREKSLAAKSVGIEVVEDAPLTETQTPLTEAVAEYLAEVKAAKAPKTFLAYSLTLTLFVRAVKKDSLEAIDRKDVLAFIAAMRSKGNGPRTIANRVAYLKGFFHRFGVALTMPAPERNHVHVVRCKGCKRCIPISVEAITGFVTVACPLCMERRSYIVSTEVFPGQPS